MAGVGVAATAPVRVAVGVSEGVQVRSGVFVGRGVRVGSRVGGSLVGRGVQVDCAGLVTESTPVVVAVCPRVTVATCVDSGVCVSKPLLLAHQIPTTTIQATTNTPAPTRSKVGRRLAARRGGGVDLRSSFSSSLRSVSAGALAGVSDCMVCSPSGAVSVVLDESGSMVLNGDIL